MSKIPVGSCCNEPRKIKKATRRSGTLNFKLIEAIMLQLRQFI